jgi:sugar lactone lactonase YvrE
MSNSFPTTDVSARQIINSQCKLGEGPLWDHRSNLLCFVDINGETYLRFDVGSGDNPQRLPVNQKVGCSALHPDGGYLLGLADGFWIFDPAHDKLEKWIAPEGHDPAKRFNDGKVDPAGRFWAGTMGGNDKSGKLYCLHPDGRLEEKLSGVAISNGLAWSSDHKRFYYIDTPTRRVDVFDYDIDTGSISNRRPAIELPEGVGYPDGMTIAKDDTLWVAMWEGHGVLHCDPVGGKIIEKLEIPTERVTCPTFGGMDLDELFVTTAGGPGEPDASADDPAGNVFSVKLPVGGEKAVVFGG